MPTDVIMPQLGESVVEGTILRWHKQVGDLVQPMDILLEISTDKVDAEIPSPVGGVLLEVLVHEGETVAKGTRLAVIGERAAAHPDAETPSFATISTAPATQTTPPPSPLPVHREGDNTAAAVTPPQAWGGARGGVEGPGVRAAAHNHGPHITPVVARMAAEHQLDLAQIHGTGHEGRVTKKDVEAYLAIRASAPPAEPELPPWERPGSGDLFKPTVEYGAPEPHSPAPAPWGEETAAQRAAPVTPRNEVRARQALPPQNTPLPAAPGNSGSGAGPGVQATDGELIPLSPMRRIIAERLSLTVQTVPMVSSVFEIDLSAVLAHRDAYKAEFEAQGVRLTLTAYFAMASVAGLRAVPAINSEWRGDAIFLHRPVHLGIAVALQRGLIVPVIQHAESLNLLGMARAVNDVADRARAGRLSPDETQGSTFSITNHGIGGSLFAQPILNAPNAGILGVGTLEKRVRVITDAQGRESLAVRPCVFLSLTFDHRLADGAEGDGFLRCVKETLEDWNQG